MRTLALPRARASAGFSIAELLVAVTIGLVLLAGLSATFVSSTRAQGEIEKANRQVENGRFALDQLAVDLRNAGYYAEFDPLVLADPAALPPPCAATVDELKAGLKLPVQGLDNNADGLGCLHDVRAGTDVLVVRRASTCVTGAAGCDPLAAGGPWFQASLCNNPFELDSADTANWYVLATAASALDRHQRDCTGAAGSGSLAATRRYLTHIYYIANNDQPGDGIPTLKRVDVVSAAGVLAAVTVPLAEGIEDLQFEYGMDLLPAGGDGAPDQYSADPGTVANWTAVVAVKVHLLARNASATPGYVDGKTYTLGPDAGGAPHQVTPGAGDHFKRHLFQSLVALPNPIGRRRP
jgi:type IV pilus assembly protein PilW